MAETIAISIIEQGLTEFFWYLAQFDAVWLLRTEFSAVEFVTGYFGEVDLDGLLLRK